MNKHLTEFSRVPIRVYWLITACFGFAYGIYGYYVFVYLNRLCGEGKSLLEPLLPVLACTMFFEFVAEPISGRFADKRGKRLAVVIAFALIAASFVMYSSAAIFRDYLKAAGLEFTGIMAIAIAAELVLATGLAFHSGALDAWVVERVFDAEQTHNVHIEPIFARGAQLFTAGLTLGGVLSTFALRQNPNSSDVTTWIWPWLVTAGVALFTMALAAAAMDDRNPSSRLDDNPVETLETNRDEPGLVQGAFRETINLLGTPSVVRALITYTSAMYVVGIVFLYFSPLLAEKALKDQQLGAWLPLLPVVLLIPRVAGPQVSVWLTKSIDPNDEDAYRKVLRWVGTFGALAAIGLGVGAWRLATSPGIWTLLFGTVCFFLTSFFHHLTKPMTSAYLNCKVEDNSQRAFVNSMATPMGGMVVAVIAVVLMVANRSTSDPKHDDLYLIFLLSGGLVLIAVVWATAKIRKAR